VPRLSIPNAIALGVVVMAIGWLVLRQPANLPIGKPDSSPILTVQLPVPDQTSVAALQATMAGLLQRLEVLEAGQSTEPLPASSLQISPEPLVAKPVFQTQVLYLGSGNTIERVWTETAAQLWLNSANYPSGVQAVFEAGLSIIGGEAWARLKNKTTGAVIFISEVSHNNNTVVWKTAPAFKLHPGNNLYVVEIKSSSGETANLAGSRIQLSQ